MSDTWNAADPTEKLGVAATKTSNGLGQPQFVLSGSNVMPTLRTITTTPLASRAGMNPTDIDLEASPGVGLVSYIISADQPTRLKFQAGDGTDFKTVGLVVVPPSSDERIVPPFRPIGRKWRVEVFNEGAAPQTVLRVYEHRFQNTSTHPQNVRAASAHQLAIRNTATHSFSTDPSYVFQFSRVAFGGGKLPIFIASSLDQATTVNVKLNMTNLMSASLGTVSVPAASNKVITNADFPGLDVPSEGAELEFTCSVAPTTGTISAYLDTLVGGGA